MFLFAFVFVTGCFGSWITKYELFMWDTSHLCTAWLIYMRYDSFIWDMTHSFTCFGAWLIRMHVWVHASQNMSHLYETKHEFCIWDLTHSWRLIFMRQWQMRICALGRCSQSSQYIDVFHRGSRLFSGFPDHHMVVWPLTKFFSVLFSKTAIFGDFLGGEVYHNSSLFDWSKHKVIGPRSYTEFKKNYRI